MQPWSINRRLTLHHIMLFLEKIESEYLIMVRKHTIAQQIKLFDIELSQLF